LPGCLLTKMLIVLGLSITMLTFSTGKAIRTCSADVRHPLH
jgi:hypothetical protein